MSAWQTSTSARQLPTYLLQTSEDGDEVGGEGGAIYTGEGSTTTFKRRTIHQDNVADNGGGALWNEGTTLLMSNGFLKGNSAKVRDISRRRCLRHPHRDNQPRLSMK